MKKLLAMAFLVVSSSVHGFDNSPNRLFDTGNMERSSSNVTWIVAKNVQQVCNEEIKKVGAKALTYKVNACAIWFSPPNNRCVIITEEKVSMHTLGHEVMHCFFGHWH
jgi:hypothetical protein